MQRKLMLAVMLLPALACAQCPDFTIAGKIGNLSKPARIYVQYFTGGKMYADSVEPVNGTFSFAGYIDGIATCCLLLAHNGNDTADRIYFTFGKETIFITSADSLRHAQIAGSQVYTEMLAFQQKTGTGITEIHRIAKQRLEKAGSEQQLDSVCLLETVAWVQKAIARRKRKLLQYAKQHPASYFSLEALAELVTNHLISPAAAEPVFNKLSDSLRFSYVAQPLYKMLK